MHGGGSAKGKIFGELGVSHRDRVKSKTVLVSLRLNGLAGTRIDGRRDVVALGRSSGLADQPSGRGGETH